MAPVVHRVTTAPGIELDVITAGPPDGLAVVLLHGFPESAHSWRHQIGPLADAGYRVLVPDQRGYAGSSAPADVGAYSADHLTADVCAVLDDAAAAGTDAEQAVIVGHDWGALLAWQMGLLHPERCRAIVTASVPFNPWPAPPTEVLRAIHGDRFFYMLYFQEPGVAEAEFDADVARFLRAVYWVASGDSAGFRRPTGNPAAGMGMTADSEQALGGRRDDLPGWLSAADFAVYVEQFERSGFRGPVNWYRNLDTNHALTGHLGPESFTMPTAFIAGEHDPVVSRREVIAAQDALLPNHLGSHIVDGAGHWVQQEAPAAVTAWLLDTLARL